MINSSRPAVSYCHARVERMKARGDTGQIKRAEENLEQIKYLHAKMDAVMTHLQVPAVDAPMKMEPRP